MLIFIINSCDEQTPPSMSRISCMVWRSSFVNPKSIISLSHALGFALYRAYFSIGCSPSSLINRINELATATSAKEVGWIVEIALAPIGVSYWNAFNSLPLFKLSNKRLSFMSTTSGCKYLSYVALKLPCQSICPYSINISMHNWIMAQPLVFKKSYLINPLASQSPKSYCVTESPLGAFIIAVELTKSLLITTPQGWLPRPLIKSSIPNAVSNNPSYLSTWFLNSVTGGIPSSKSP